MVFTINIVGLFTATQFTMRSAHASLIFFPAWHIGARQMQNVFPKSDYNFFSLMKDDFIYRYKNVIKMNFVDIIIILLHIMLW